MNLDYIYNTVKLLLEQRKGKDPSGVPYNVLFDAIIEDTRMALNELVSEKN